MESDYIFNFEEEGVTVILPDGAENLAVRRVEPSKWEESARQEYLSPEEVPFILKRFVIEIEFYDRENPEKPLPAWSARAQLRVRYTPLDVRNAGGNWENLKLGYFWEDRWQPFTEKKHDYKTIPDDGNPEYGFGVAYLDNWEDPAIGWDA